MNYGDIEPTMPGCEQGGLQGSQPYRTAYHFQPAKNWMNGPMIYQGIYHFFYQYNPNGAVWNNISWGHSTSTDLVNWTPQPIAMWPSQPGDINGCFSGSATILPGEVPALLYTGGNSKNEQVQNLALPKDLSDPYLIEWVKSQHNPLMIPSNENKIGVDVFRDPSTAWLGNDGHWRVAIGIERNRTGVAIIYKSKDFIHWTMDVEHQLHSTKDTGMWECVDFFPVATSSLKGLDTSTTGYGTKHVLKSSMVDVQCDYYTIGIYDTDKDIFTPDMDFSSDHSGLRFDYGKFYASKTFFDCSTNRRILWGWVKETTDTATDIMKGWSGLQAIPRSIWLDESGKQLVQWPITEIEKLRMNEVNLHNELLKRDSVLEVHGITCSQADVEVSFSITNFENAEILDPSWTDPQMICSQKGASVKGGIGPFGLLVLASENMEEYTAVYFNVFKKESGYVVLMCTDLSKSSSSLDYEKPTYGAFLDINPVNEELTLRSLVDHSIVESFGGRGKTSMIARVYPTLAVNSEARLYAFNNVRSPW
ncbi:hypothetical protein Leryth_001909 [Lithospermum erythrorhizon]|nr:hypothetical protein Leryth_001909 [Lithospermum erythrorhizon]